jgi:hypothetical protein
VSNRSGKRLGSIAPTTSATARSYHISRIIRTIRRRAPAIRLIRTRPRAAPHNFSSAFLSQSPPRRHRPLASMPFRSAPFTRCARLWPHSRSWPRTPENQLSVWQDSVNHSNARIANRIACREFTMGKEPNGCRTPYQIERKASCANAYHTFPFYSPRHPFDSIIIDSC